MPRRTTTAALLIGAAALPALTLGVAASAATPHVAAKSSATTIALRSTSHGKVLVGKGGRALYDFGKDQKNVSHCNASCQATWAPVPSGAHAGAGVKSAHLGHTRQGQATYYGRPLYYYAGDTKAGQTNGEGVKEYGAVWYLVNAKGASVR